MTTEKQPEKSLVEPKEALKAEPEIQELTDGDVTKLTGGTSLKKAALTKTDAVKLPGIENPLCAL